MVLIMNSLMIGDKITIRYSKQLDKNGNNILTNKTGIVTKLMKIGKNIIGVYADVKVMRRTRNYYVPVCSIEGPDGIDKTRTLSILKSTIL